MADIVSALGWAEPFEEAADGLPECLDGSLGGIAKQALELGERQLDWVQVRAVGRQIEHPRVDCFDGLAHAADFVRAERCGCCSGARTSISGVRFSSRTGDDADLALRRWISASWNPRARR